MAYTRTEYATLLLRRKDSNSFRTKEFNCFFFSGMIGWSLIEKLRLFRHQCRKAGAFSFYTLLL
jgi:hypothetical protein